MTETDAASTTTYHIEQKLSDGSWSRLGEQRESLFETFSELMRVTNDNPSQQFTVIETVITRRVLK